MKVRVLWMTAVILMFGIAVAGPARGAAQDEWKQVLAKAKEEGTVSVMGPLGTDTRDILTQPFEKKYGIKVEYFGGRGGQQSTRVGLERRAGKYLWDVFVGGTTTGLTAMIPMEAFDPFETALILPEVKNPKLWRHGQLEFVDQGRHMLVMTPTHRVTVAVNPSLLKPEEFQSYKDLLKPEWKGKVVLADPRRPGSSQATFTFFLLHPNLGADFIYAFAATHPVMIADPSQAQDLVTRGNYPILVGPRSSILADALRRGLPIQYVDPSKIKEGSDISPGPGAVALMNGAPHPNAAKVYINWLLSKDGQYGFGKILGYVSNRLDVPNDYYADEPWRVPQPNAIKTYDHAAMEVKDDLVAVLNKAFGGTSGEKRR